MNSSKPLENALLQAIHIANDLLVYEREATTNSTEGEGIQITLLHVVEEIHVRFPNMYIGYGIIAGKPLKEFFKEVYAYLGFYCPAEKLYNHTCPVLAEA
jgi:hypothetical protein